jgi:hypothetical protein
MKTVLNCVCVTLLLLPAPAAADRPLFASDDVLRISISAPLESILRERDSEEYFAGTLAYQGDAGEARELDVRIRARGNYRRQERTCQFPPLRLNFVRKDMAGTIFEGQDKLKLVTHCQTYSARYEQMVLREFLAYRILQAVTDNSFDVRLLQINWHDTDDDDEPFERYAFLIEDDDLLAKRIGLEVAEVGHAFPSQLNREQASLIGVFEYLIGNTDFSMLRGPAADDCCHNAVLLKSGNEYLPVPYDFDFAGLVDAPYAAPNPNLRIKDVKTRLYRGRCQHNSLLDDTLRRFKGAKGKIMALIDQQEGLTDSVRRSVRRYVERFYNDIDSPKQVERRLVKKCV